MQKSSTPEKILDQHKSRSSSKDNLLGDNLDQDSPGKLHSSIEKSMNISSTNSPKLGVKMLGTHISKNASNVAVVQPRPGEKIDKTEKLEKKETTFDSEIRTETTEKMSSEMDQNNTHSGKETTFLTPDKEDKATFLDDAGEAMDIKPMPPIMRALPYGYFRGYTGYGGFSNRNFHIPGRLT